MEHAEEIQRNDEGHRGGPRPSRMRASLALLRERESAIVIHACAEMRELPIRARSAFAVERAPRLFGRPLVLDHPRRPSLTLPEELLQISLDR